MKVPKVEQDVVDMIGAAESLSLDFKSSEGMFSGGRLTKEGRRVVAKALSAFANSAGGRLVIGLDCRPVEGVDVATALTPIAEFAKVVSALNGELGGLIQPRHDGVQLYPIPAASEDQGYLVIEVPRSERRPHMSNVEKTYHKRAGAQTFTMEHYDIEDAFKRATVPELSVRWLLEEGSSSSHEVQASANFLVTNDGPVSAKSVTLSIVASVGMTLNVASPGHPADFRGAHVAGRTVISAPPQLVINPGQTVRFHRMSLRVTKEIGGVIRVNGSRWRDAYVDMECLLGAENMRPTPARLSLVQNDLVGLLRSLGEHQLD